MGSWRSVVGSWRSLDVTGCHWALFKSSICTMNTMDIMYGPSVLLTIFAIWDFGCALSILLHIPPLNSQHISFWKDENDQTNPAASHLMAYLIFVWGWMRLLAGMGWPMEWACVSYLIEGCVFGCEVLFGRMYAKGMLVSLLSFLLAFYFNQFVSLPGSILCIH